VETGGNEMTKVKGRGVIIPVDWDEKGNVVAVGISTHGEDEYLIDSEEKGEELRSLISEEVEVVGKVREENRKRILTVKKYNLIKGSA
jgi:5S rRNA maturation endonuclease (ribonuclease M5)